MKKKKPDIVRTTTIGLAVYRRDQWLRWLTSVDDPDKFEATWEGWHVAMMQAKAQFHAQRIPVEEVTIDLDLFETWRRSKNLKNNAASRSQYVAYCLSSKHE